MSETPELHIEVESLLASGDAAAAKRLLENRHEADIAEVIFNLSSEQRPALFDLVPDDLKPAVLAELEELDGEREVLDDLTDAEISEIAEEMAPDDAADILAELDEERSEHVLDLMEEEESKDVRELLKYDEETAGGIMTTDVVALNGRLTLDEAMAALSGTEQEEPFFFIYVVDDHQHLQGVIGLWRLLRIKDRSQQLQDLARTDVISVPVDLDQEEVARTMQKYDMASLPVLDASGALVGRVTIDDVVDIIEEEATEDILTMGGTDESELTYSSPLTALRVRLPWLLITLGSGFVYSLIFKKFMAGFSDLMILSIFVPIVMAMSGNTGIQSSTLMVRGMAVGSFSSGKIGDVLKREIWAGLSMGLVCGVLIGIWTQVVLHFGTDPLPVSPAYLGLVTGISLATAMAGAALFGALVPVLFERIKVDPAVASGPFITASIDILALLIYFGISLGLMKLYYLA